MRSILWPDGSYEEHLSEAKQTLATGMNGILPMVTLVAEDETGSLVGFLDVGLRSHADGCDERQPVGFVEGWFVDPRVRQRGVGRVDAGCGRVGQKSGMQRDGIRHLD
jgi:aminoglycoside 6'-N-acetyltransferase I